MSSTLSRASSEIVINPVKSPFIPPRPSTICRVCWEGPFAAHLGVLGPPTPMPHLTPLPQGSYSYTTTRAELEFRASKGCLWCRFVCALCEHGLDGTLGRGDGMEIRLFEGREMSAISESTPRHTQTLSAFVNNTAGCRGYLHTAAGQFIHAHMQATEL